MDLTDHNERTRGKIKKIESWNIILGGIKMLDHERRMKDLSEKAASRGGCIADGSVYKNCKTKMQFLDSSGNKFEAIPGAIIRGQWSPYDRYISEHVCRQTMEFLFQKSFPSRWDIVKRPNGNRLQLDGYNENLKIGFEYQGFFHETCKNQKIRDNEKRIFCKNNNIILIEVRDFGTKHMFNSSEILGLVLYDVLKCLKNFVCQNQNSRQMDLSWI